MWRPPRRLAVLCTSVLILAGCTSGEGPADGTSSGPPGETPGPGVIVQLRADQPAEWDPSGRGWAVSLTWSTSPGGAGDRYEVRRDGVPIARDLTEPAYRDHGVDPGVAYGYTVLGTDPSGVLTPARIGVRTGAPPVADARLEGSFLVELRVSESSGLSDTASPGHLLFRYAPRCRQGACAVRWSVRARAPDGLLARSAGRYGGRASGPFMIRSCNGRPLRDRLDVSTTVVGAGPIARRWRATQIAGVLSEEGHAAGCAPAHLRWRFAGVIQT